MTEKEALQAVRNAIAPESLSYVQEIVFTQSWAGQLYPEIAKSVGYHLEYTRGDNQRTSQFRDRAA
ncbi:MAG: hypothetical protein AAGC93_05960, partial [Cyanobacteria bacterium P01_F01_bin.53]